MHKLGVFTFGSLLILAKVMSSLSSNPQQEAHFSYIASEAIVMEAFFLFVTCFCNSILKVLSLIGKRTPSENDMELSAVISLFVTFAFFAWITIPPNIIYFIANIIS